MGVSIPKVSWEQPLQIPSAGQVHFVSVWKVILGSHFSALELPQLVVCREQVQTSSVRNVVRASLSGLWQSFLFQVGHRQGLCFGEFVLLHVILFEYSLLAL